MMQEFSLETLLQFVLMNDAVFYGLVAIIIVVLLLVAWRLTRAERGKAQPIEPPAGLEGGPALDRMFEEEVEAEVEEARAGERIDEPVVQPTRGRTLTPRREPDGKTDTVEVYRVLSTDAEAPQFETRPIGEEARRAEPAPTPVVEPAPRPEPAKPVAKPRPAEPIAAPKTLEEGLEKTKGGFIKRLNALVFGKKEIDDSILEELEQILYEADIGPTATRLFDSVAESAKRRELADVTRLREMLREKIAGILVKAEQPYTLSGPAPQVILMIGVNGVGKTTTIGKLARQFTDQGKKVMLAAGDTFRAAAVEQLKIWGERAGAEVIAAGEGANPSSVLYSAVQAAQARGADLLIADTAGRLHTKYNLMEELKKMKAVCAKALGRDPDEIWLVIDANTGQNAVAQAAKFHEALGLTGLVLTKLDGTAKGGVVIGITDQLGLPIRYIGIGEHVGDLRPFAAAAFVEALF